MIISVDMKTIQSSGIKKKHPVYIYVVFDYPAASSSLGRGMQQSACVYGGPPDRSVIGVYVQQVAILPVFPHTFIPSLSRASTASVPLHFHHSNRRNRAIFRGSADMPVPTEPSSTSGRGNLLQTKQGIELYNKFECSNCMTSEMTKRRQA